MKDWPLFCINLVLFSYPCYYMALTFKSNILLPLLRLGKTFTVSIFIRLFPLYLFQFREWHLDKGFLPIHSYCFSLITLAVLQMRVLSGFSTQKTMSGALSKSGVSLPDIHQVIYNVDSPIKIMRTEENTNLEKYKIHSFFLLVCHMILLISFWFCLLNEQLHFKML